MDSCNLPKIRDKKVLLLIAFTLQMPHNSSRNHFAVHWIVVSFIQLWVYSRSSCEINHFQITFKTVPLLWLQENIKYFLLYILKNTFPTFMEFLWIFDQFQGAWFSITVLSMTLLLYKTFFFSEILSRPENSTRFTWPTSYMDVCWTGFRNVYPVVSLVQIWF